MCTLYDTRYYHVVKLFCSTVGLWPYQPRYKRRIILWFQMFILFSYIPPQMNRLCQVWGKDMDAMCVCLLPLVTLVLSTIKAMTIIQFHSEIKILLCQIETEWEKTLTKEEYNILMNYTLKSRRFCIAYSSLLFSGLLVYIVMPTFIPMLNVILPRNETRVKSLAFDLDYGIDQQDYWFWLWLHSSMAGSVVIIHTISADLLYITLTIHCCYLFAVARHKLEHMADSVKEDAVEAFNNHNTEYNGYEYDTGIQSKSAKQAVSVGECVIRHKKAIKYFQLLHNIYTWNFLGTLCIGMIIISIASVQLVSKLSQWTGIIMSIVYVVGNLIHVFFLNLMAQYILNQSEKIHKSTYSTSWYNMSTKFQKDVIFILMKSRTPCKLTAGKLYVVSLENFCTILQTSMSYFTLLASFR